jgi:hypothetical protein
VVFADEVRPARGRHVDVIEVKREGGMTTRRVVVGGGGGDDEIVEIKEEPTDE